MTTQIETPANANGQTAKDLRMIARDVLMLAQKFDRHDPAKATNIRSEAETVLLEALRLDKAEAAQWAAVAGVVRV